MLDLISAKKKIWGNIPYNVYYFSCNLEWVLHNSFRNHTDDEKRDFAEAFAEKYEHDVAGFICFINGEELIVPGGYEETWKYIQNEKMKIPRKSNLHLFVNELANG